MGKGSSGSNTSTVTSNTQPPQQFEDALTSALGTAQAVGQTPYSNYPGQLQAPFSPQQQEAFDLVGSTPGISAPYINAAAQYINAATTPLQPTIQPYANQAQQYIGQAAGTNLLGSVQPYINQAQQYTGQAAGTNLLGSVQPYINQAEGNVNAATGTNLGAAVNPYLNQAQQYFGQAQNLYGQNAGNAANFNVSPYMNPYVNSVVNATQAQFNNQNQQQQAQLAGNAASAGALGGSREGVAQGVLAGQQQLAQAPVIAGLYNQGFGQAQQEFNSQQQAAQSAAAGLGSLGQGQLGAGQESLGANLGQAGLYNTAATTLGSLGQQALGANLGQAGLYNTAATTSGALGQQALGATSGQAGLYNTAAGGLTNIGGQLLGANEANAWLNSQAGFGMANLGNQALNSTLTSANALAGAGATQQAQAQQALNIPYEQWIAQQSYPFQTASWQSGLTGQLANAAGGTASTTSPGPDPFSQIAGLGLGAAGLTAATGGFGSNGWLTGLLNGGAGSGAAATAAGIGGLGGVSNIAALGAGTADAVSSFSAADLAGLGFDAFGVPAPARGGAISAYLKKAQRAAGGSVPKAPSNTGPVNVTLQPSTKGQGFGVPPGSIGIPGIDPSAGALDFGQLAGSPGGGGKRGGRAGGFADGGDVGDDVPLDYQGLPTDESARALTDRVTAMGGDPYRDAPSPAGTPGRGLDSYRNSPSPASLPGFAAPSGGFGNPAAVDVGNGPPAPPPAARDTGEPLPSHVSRETSPSAGLGSVPRGANPWLAVADAGFAMAAGKSPNALSNIGAGLQHGVESYMTHDQAAQALSARVDEARAQLADTQLYHQQTNDIATGRLGLEAQQLAQTGAHQNATLDLEREKLDQGKYTWQPGVGPDPNDPNKQVAGMYKLPSKGDEKPQFIPGMTTTNKPEAGMAGATVGGSGGTATGDDYLKTLAPNVATQVKAIADGRMPLPSGFALKSPYWQQMLSSVSQYDPTFDAVNYNARSQTRKDFTSGQSARNVTSLNTVMGHISALKDAGEALQNGSVPLVNSAVNFIKTQTGNPEVNNFQTAADAVADELEKAFRGTAGAVTGIRNWRERLNPSASPEQQAGAWKELTTLLDSRIDSLGDQYSRGMGKTMPGLQLLAPHAREAYAKITGHPAETPTYGQTGERTDQSVGTTGATAPQWRYSATGNSGFKAYSNDGQTWFNANGSPIASPATP